MAQRSITTLYATGAPMFGAAADFVIGHTGPYPLNGAHRSWAATASAPAASYDSIAAAAQGCTTFRGAGHPHGPGTYCFTTTELEVFAVTL